MWGNHFDVTVEPRAALSEFLAGLADRGLTAGLSTWLTPDKTGRAEQVRTPEDLARIWIETLRFPLTLSYYLRSPDLPLRTDLQRLATDEFDFAEPHIWLAAASPKFVGRTAWRNDWSDDVTVLTDHERLIRRRYAVEREDYLAELAIALDEW